MFVPPSPAEKNGSSGGTAGTFKTGGWGSRGNTTETNARKTKNTHEVLGKRVTTSHQTPRQTSPWAYIHMRTPVTSHNERRPIRETNQLLSKARKAPNRTARPIYKARYSSVAQPPPTVSRMMALDPSRLELSESVSFDSRHPLRGVQ